MARHHLAQGKVDRLALCPQAGQPQHLAHHVVIDLNVRPHTHDHTPKQSHVIHNLREVQQHRDPLPCPDAHRHLPRQPPLHPRRRARRRAGLRLRRRDHDRVALTARGACAPARVHPLQDLHLLAPVPTPPSVRDFFAFEEHVAAGLAAPRRRDPGGLVRGSRSSTSPTPRRSAARATRSRAPPTASMLDFELEIAAVIGTDNEIAGFTLMNDWSARDLQIKEMTVGLGPAKGKDFATSLGPMLVTPDELPYEDGRLHARGDRHRERRRGHQQRRRRSSTSHGRRSSSTPRATPSCAPATCSARERSAEAACSSWARSRATAGSSPATSSRSTRRGSVRSRIRSSDERQCGQHLGRRAGGLHREPHHGPGHENRGHPAASKASACVA